MIGGPNPDGNYFLAMIRGDRRYRITGTRGTSAYLGFQILAGTGLTPRRMSNYVSDVAPGAQPAVEFAAAAVVGRARRSRRRAVGAASPRTPRRSSSGSTSVIAPPKSWPPCGSRRSIPDPVAALTDDELAEQFTAMAWSLMKLATLHRTIKPELLGAPQRRC